MDEVAGAIADPVRREIMVMLRERRMSAGQIADRFTISRPAVSRHLRVLRESGLVHDELTGRQRFYRLDPAPLTELVGWLAPFMPAGLVAGQPATLATDAATRVATPATDVAATAGPRAGDAAALAGDEGAAWERRFDALETEVYRARRERRTPPAAGVTGAGRRAAGRSEAGSGKGAAAEAGRDRFDQRVPPRAAQREERSA
ncbi:metalloregulator ArsR/SmtB family transcription factor [Phytohabitans kaempferiae]|uniref:Metalloregulator ArsR/SmtB family transcription factor n=1 Tax=Phytohabitans kaempferiae TaxID=1620943 RepID=A0ABV6MG55_9ACTN